MNFGEAETRAPVRTGLRERLLAARSVGLFADVDNDAATLLTEHSRLLFFDRGAVVAKRDEVVDVVHVVLEGNIRIGDEGATQLDAGPGSPIGFIALLTADAPRPVATATEPTRTLAIPSDVILSALEENFSLWRSALRLVTGALLGARGELPGADEPQGPDPVDDQRPRLLVERALEISNVGLFDKVNVDAVFDVARIMRERRVPAGHVFWQAGETPKSSIRILSGRVRCTTPSGESKLVGRDNLIGTVTAAAGRMHGYAVVAETAVRVYEIDFEDWLLVLEAHPELAMRLLSVFTAALANTLASQDRISR